MISNSYDVNLANHDIILNFYNDALQRILELHSSYNPLQYMLQFSNSDDTNLS